MEFRWDWLEPAIQAPYVPTLGVVAPESLSAALFDAVADAAGHDGFLPYDKDRRWFASKSEHVLRAATIHRPDCTQIATLISGKMVKLHHYSAELPDLEEATRYVADLAAQHGATSHRIVGAIGPLPTPVDASGVRFLAPPYFAVHRDFRRQGFGRELWRAAAAWARDRGAAYHVLQAAVGSGAEQLYLSEGLRTVGFAHST